MGGTGASDNSRPQPLPPFGSHPLDNLVPSPSSDKENMTLENAIGDATRETTQEMGAGPTRTHAQPPDYHERETARGQSMDPLQVMR